MRKKPNYIKKIQIIKRETQK